MLPANCTRSISSGLTVRIISRRWVRIRQCCICIYHSMSLQLYLIMDYKLYKSNFPLEPDRECDITFIINQFYNILHWISLFNDYFKSFYSNCVKNQIPEETRFYEYGAESCVNFLAISHQFPDSSSPNCCQGLLRIARRVRRILKRSLFGVWWNKKHFIRN